MVSFSVPKRSDKDYPVWMLSVVQSAHAAIIGEKSPFFRKKTTISNVNDLFNKLESMKQKEGSPYSEEFESLRDPCYWRKPMWGVVDSVFKDEIEAHDLLAGLLKDSEDRIEWFQGILKLCFRYEMLQVKTKAYVESIKEIGLCVGVDETDIINSVTVLFDNGSIGRNAHPVAERVIQALLKAGTLHVERFLADGYTYPDVQMEYS